MSILSGLLHNKLGINKNGGKNHLSAVFFMGDA